MSWFDFLSWFKPAVPIKPVVIEPDPFPVIDDPMTGISIPSCGLDLIKKWEGCKQEAYPDQRGIPTVGFGHTCGVKLGDTCTQQQADEWLKQDAAFAWNAVCANVRVPLTSNQGGALLSFVYNAGVHRFVESHLLAFLNNGSYSMIPGELKKFVFITLPNGNHVIDKGLVNRRNDEAKLWIGSDWRQS